MTSRLIVSFSLRTIAFAVVLGAIMPVATLSAQRLPDMETRNVAGDQGTLHDFLDSSGETLVALSMARDQETGEEQIETLLSTHRALDRDPRFPSDRVLHISVITGAPWFVHGVIRRGLASEYGPAVEDNQIIVLFIDDLDDFSDRVEIPVTRHPSWLSVSPEGHVNWWERDRGQGIASSLLQKLDW